MVERENSVIDALSILVDRAEKSDLSVTATNVGAKPTLSFNRRHQAYTGRGTDQEQTGGN